MKSLLLLWTCACLVAAPPSPPAKPAPKPLPSPIAVDQVNNSSLTDEVNPQSSGSATLRAQILLDRAHFSPGQIDGQFGENLARAIAAYRESNGLPANPAIDAAMWAKLNQDAAPAIQQYTLSPEDVSGPYTPDIPTDLMAQSKLSALNYRNAPEALGEKFHCSAKLLQDLNPQADLTQAGTQLMAPNVIVGPPSGQVAQITVSKAKGIVQALDSSGKVLVTYPATMGSEHDPLPIGDWQIAYISKYPYFHYNAALFWDAKNKSEKAVLKPGPNSPVGVVWMGLTKEHYGIHGTENPATIGHTQSHGCIRLTNWDAMELAGMVSKGTPVILKED